MELLSIAKQLSARNMNKITIQIIKTIAVSDKLVEELMLIINKTNSFQCNRINGIINELDDEFDWQECFEKLRTIRKEKSIDENEFIVLLADKSNSKNWFSACNPNGSKEIFIQTTDWDNYIYAKQVYPICYQVVSNVLQQKLFVNDTSYSWTHEYPIGCMNDMCSWKEDINLKLKTADICTTCLDLLNENFQDNIIQDTIKIFDDVRKKTLSTSTFYESPKFEQHSHTPIAITKKKISTSSDPLRKSLFAIDHFDLLVKLLIIYTTKIVKEKNSETEFYSENNLNEQPSLGHWVAAISKLKNLNGTDLITTAVSNIIDKINRVLQISSNNNIVQIRNESRGHGYINCCDQNYQSTFIALNSALGKIEKLFEDIFSKFELCKTLSISKKSESLYIAKINILKGSDLLFEEIELKLSSNPDFIDNHLYLVSEDRTHWYDLYPNLVFDTCPKCNHPRLMVKDGNKYIDIYIGHRVEINLADNDS